MKKLAFLFVACAAVSFAACGGNASQADAVVEEDSVAVEEVVEEVVDSAAVVDSTVADSAAVEAAAEAPAAQ